MIYPDGFYTEDDILPLSALQHMLFCDRQCALIHIEQIWVENLYTAEGRIMHERVDSGRSETRGDVRLSFSLPLRSLRLGLSGKADVVEFHREQYGNGKNHQMQRTGFSDEDANLIKCILPKLFENDASSARPEGSMAVKKVIWWQHNCKSGQYSSARVHRTLTVSPDGSYQLENFVGLAPEEIDGF